MNSWQLITCCWTVIQMNCGRKCAHLITDRHLEYRIANKCRNMCGNFCILLPRKFVLVFNLYVNYMPLLRSISLAVWVCVGVAVGSCEGRADVAPAVALSVFVNYYYFFLYYAWLHIPNVFSPGCRLFLCLPGCLLIILY